MIVFSICLSVLSVVLARAPAANDASYKGQFCTDPRTMRNHAAYTEWADAYSCTRHRCQPGGRNLAIYTVGCKRVEAPESAIECEEVVEDTNMQFPYCCTRLRCLVVVRGEVWTRVLGQPWETLPAAPWSHMYKMKKPPPADGFAPKQGEGPVYELQPPTDTEDEPNLRAKKNTEPPPSAPILPAAPDIVLALSTDTDKDLTAKNNEEPKDGRRFTRQKGVSARKQQSASGAFSLQDLITDVEPHPHEIMNEEFEEQETRREQGGEPSHEEANVNIEEKAGLKITSAEEQVEERREHTRHREQEASTHLPDVFDHEQGVPPIEASQLKQQPKAETTDEGGPEQNMQALVNAIGSRMKDIESVVAKMTDRASKPVADDHADDGSAEKVTLRSIDWAAGRRPHHEKDGDKAKKPNPDGEHYKRFPGRGKSKYLHNGDATDVPLLAENSHSNGYYSDASNIVQRAPPKEPGPAATYMAPVENRKKASPEDSGERKHKKKAHKKKKSKGHHRSHHEHERGKDDVKRKRFNKVISAEMDKNAVSLEDDKEFPFGNKS